MDVPNSTQNGRLWLTSGELEYSMGNSTLPENLPDVGLIAAIYQKLKVCIRIV